MIDTILSWSHWSDTLGLLGVLLLGLPALAASRSASVAHRVEHGPHGPGVDERLRDAQRRLVSELWDRARRWSPVHGYLLWAGYALTVLPFVVRFASQ